jgi:hypothetical protein
MALPSSRKSFQIFHRQIVVGGGKAIGQAAHMDAGGTLAGIGKRPARFQQLQQSCR